MASIQLLTTIARLIQRAVQFHTRKAIPLMVAKRMEATSPLTSVQPRPKRFDIMFFVNKNNSLSQRVAAELMAKKHTVRVCEISQSEKTTQLALDHNPDLILCPFLTRRVPDEVYNNPTIPCLIVHPGIEGDRGMSSIDWALKEDVGEWGVTVMQAAEEMDAGDIWSTSTFLINRENINTLTKSSLYAHEVTSAAVLNCVKAVENLARGIKPRSLNYSQPNVRGRLKPNMKKVDRVVDWELPATDVARLVRMSDSSPGAVGRFRQSSVRSEWSKEFRLFGSFLEESTSHDNLSAAPGEILGARDNGILVKCGVGSLWISHLKRNKLKLPATLWLRDMNLTSLPVPSYELPYGSFPRTFQEIWTSVSPEGVCNVHFEFYNGAMSTRQCRRLLCVLGDVERDERVKVIVLRGGYNFFSNGIHLNVIENARDPYEESWRNINAIDDVVKCLFTNKKLTIAALRGNAGAGGVMVALASDVIVSRDGVVLNPHYKNMHLYGSEYHTYFLSERVGVNKAEELLTAAAPVMASEAVKIGLIDNCEGNGNREFIEYVEEIARELVSTPGYLGMLMRKKDVKRTQEWLDRLESHRVNELAVMKKNFASKEYNDARRAFVYH